MSTLATVGSTTSEARFSHRGATRSRSTDLFVGGAAKMDRPSSRAGQCSWPDAAPPMNPVPLPAERGNLVVMRRLGASAILLATSANLVGHL
jgi:hypothetical protein